MNIICISGTLMIHTKILWLIIFGRLLQGVFIGLNSTIAPVYIKQFIPQTNGRYGIYHQFFIVGGILMGFFLSFLLNQIF